MKTTTTEKNTTEADYIVKYDSDSWKLYGKMTYKQFKFIDKLIDKNESRMLNDWYEVVGGSKYHIMKNIDKITASELINVLINTNMTIKFEKIN